MPHFLTSFIRRAARFHAETDGAVTVDFVVLTAGVVGLAIFVMSPFGLAPLELGTQTNDDLAAAREAIFGDDFINIPGQ